MTYIWRLVPHVYIPVDYFHSNLLRKAGGDLPLYKHPVYSWEDFDEENEYHEVE